MGVSLPVCSPGEVVVLEPAPDAIPASAAEPDATQVQASIREPASIPVQGGIQERAETPAVSVIPALPVAALTSIPVEAEKQAAAAGFEPQAQAAIAAPVLIRAPPFQAVEPAATQAQAVQAAVERPIRAQAVALQLEPESMPKGGCEQSVPGSKPTDDLLHREPDAPLRGRPRVLGGNRQRAQLEPTGHRSRAGSRPPIAAAHDSGWRTGPYSAWPPAHCCAGPAAVRSGARSVLQPVPASGGNSVRHCRRCS